MKKLAWSIATLLALPTCETPEAEQEACLAKGITKKSRPKAGDPTGHKDPVGAKGKGQARAAKIASPDLIRQPENARGKVRLGDFLLQNDKVAFYIEGARPSDGYSSLGGELLAADLAGADGKPQGLSHYNETLMTLARQAIAPESVTVLNDGADGQAAVVRAVGVLKNIPFLDTFADLLPGEYDFPGALDYVLEPGSERLLIRLTLLNTTAEEVDFNTRRGLGFFQSSRFRTYTENQGFAEPKGYSDYIAFDNTAADGASPLGFVFRIPSSQMRYLLGVSGFQYFQPSAFTLPACGEKTVDYAEIIPGGPYLDGLLAAKRRVDGDTSHREIRGKVTDASGGKMAGAVVHVVAQGQAPEDQRLLSQTVAAADGTFVVHGKGAVDLYATVPGYPRSAKVSLMADIKTADLQIARDGFLTVRAKDNKNKMPMPVRVQVIPDAPMAELPPGWGVPKENNGRLHQAFPENGEVTLPLPPGSHKVLVSHGFEWEIFEQKVTIEAGKTVTLEPLLVQSVDSRGVMCADFHIHSNFSADSSDGVADKVRSALADGLEIPVSSEHEWIIDFQPVIKRLGEASKIDLTRFAFGMPSEEFTTFTWGHFGIVPIKPRPEKQNSGAIQWVGRKPGEVFREIRDLPEKPVLIVNHPSGGGFGAYFSAAGFRRDIGSGDPDLWSDDFEAIEVFNDEDLEGARKKAVADWFALLNVGKVRWAVGNSDSHYLRGSPVGYPRTCLRFGHDQPEKLTAEDVRDSLRKGQAVVSGGIYLTVEGAFGVGPGGTLPAGVPREFNVVVQTPSWLSAKTLEVIVDGETSQMIQLQQSVGGPGKRYEALVKVTAPAGRPSHWVVFHASAGGQDLAPLAPGRRAFAVSNPIFF